MGVTHVCRREGSHTKVLVKPGQCNGGEVFHSDDLHHQRARPKSSLCACIQPVFAAHVKSEIVEILFLLFFFCFVLFF